MWGNTNLDIINFSDGLVLIAIFLFWLFLETCCMRYWPLYQVQQRGCGGKSIECVFVHDG